MEIIKQLRINSFFESLPFFAVDSNSDHSTALPFRSFMVISYITEPTIRVVIVVSRQRNQTAEIVEFTLEITSSELIIKFIWARENSRKVHDNFWFSSEIKEKNLFMMNFMMSLGWQNEKYVIKFSDCEAQNYEEFHSRHFLLVSAEFLTCAKKNIKIHA